MINLRISTNMPLSNHTWVWASSPSTPELGSTPVVDDPGPLGSGHGVEKTCDMLVEESNIAPNYTTLRVSRRAVVCTYSAGKEEFSNCFTPFDNFESYLPVSGEKLC
jgi:hypothetical protein